MAYLLPTDYENYGLPAGTTPDWVTTATALINSFCRRPDLNVTQYQERLRMVSGTQRVRLSYLPLAPLGTATSPLVAMEGKYGQPRRWHFRCRGSGRQSIRRQWTMRPIRGS